MRISILLASLFSQLLASVHSLRTWQQLIEEYENRVDDWGNTLPQMEDFYQNMMNDDDEDADGLYCSKTKRTMKLRFWTWSRSRRWPRQVERSADPILKLHHRVVLQHPHLNPTNRTDSKQGYSAAAVLRRWRYIHWRRPEDEALPQRKVKNIGKKGGLTFYKWEPNRTCLPNGHKFSAITGKASDCCSKKARSLNPFEMKCKPWLCF